MKLQTIALIGLILFLEALAIYYGGSIYFTDIKGADSVKTLNLLTYQVTHQVKGYSLAGPPTINLFTLSILIIIIVDGIIVIWKILSMRYRRRVRSERRDLGKDAFLDAGEATFSE